MSTAVADQTLTALDRDVEDIAVADRCDRCNAQAFYKFKKTFDDGLKGEMLMCAHHGRHHEPVFLARGWDVYDFTDRLNEKPTDPSIDDI